MIQKLAAGCMVGLLFWQAYLLVVNSIQLFTMLH